MQEQRDHLRAVPVAEKDVVDGTLALGEGEGRIEIRPLVETPQPKPRPTDRGTLVVPIGDHQDRITLFDECGDQSETLFEPVVAPAVNQHHPSGAAPLDEPSGIGAEVARHPYLLERQPVSHPGIERIGVTIEPDHITGEDLADDRPIVPLDSVVCDPRDRVHLGVCQP